MQQTTNYIMMVRPANFGFNAETAGSNAFQNAEACTSETHDKAIAEFTSFVNTLMQNGVNVTVIYDTPEPHKPDSIFPNNWVTFHEDGTLILYPMMAVNRRWERRRSILDFIGQSFEIKNEIDLSHYEESNQFLEGTGSMIFDRSHKIAYACYSPRTNHEVLRDFNQKTGFSVIAFHSFDRNGKDIYHTNVMMAMAEQFVMICEDSITIESEKAFLRQKFQETNKEIVAISFDQMEHFAGNALAVKDNKGQQLLVMSEQAFLSLKPAQIQQINKYAKIVHSPLYHIEANGGGSARCMMAEIFLPKKAVKPVETQIAEEANA